MTTPKLPCHVTHGAAIMDANRHVVATAVSIDYADWLVAAVNAHAAPPPTAAKEVEDLNADEQAALESLRRDYSSSSAWSALWRDHSSLTRDIDHLLAFVDRYQAILSQRDEQHAHLQQQISNMQSVEARQLAYNGEYLARAMRAEKQVAALQEALESAAKDAIRFQDKAKALQGEVEWEVEWLRRIPFICPPCNGCGTVSRPPWIAGDIVSWDATAEMRGPFPCRACSGKGVLWQDSSHLFSPPPRIAA